MLRSLIYNACRSHQSITRQVPRIGQIRPFGSKIQGYVKTMIKTKQKLDPSQLDQPQPETSSISSVYGQPTSRTHPHLIKEGELVPGINRNEFVERRRNLMQLLSTEDKDHDSFIVIIPSASKSYMSENIPYFFRQNSDFLYLSGCLEPDSALVLSGTNDDFTSALFLRKSDAHSDLWEGPRTGIDVAPEMFAVDKAFHMDQLRQYLYGRILKLNDFQMYYDENNPPSTPVLEVVKKDVFKHVQSFDNYRSGKFYLHKLRAIKSPAEQNLMRKAGEISSEAIKKAMKCTKPAMTEHQLFSIVDHECQMLGAEFLAYPPVVAAGNNATIIHYVNNNQQIQETDLILMDAGCEYHGYCADITRTWPASGKFNDYQRILYEVVLEVQKEILSSCDERLSLDAMHFKMVHLLGEYLSKENIIKKDVISSVEKNRIACDLCPHRVSHYLGMDVHDVASYPKNIPLQPGMVVTVEPGLYVRENDENVPPEFWNTGIRIEDDVLITDTGYEVLSAECPKEVDDIENLMKS